MPSVLRPFAIILLALAALLAMAATSALAAAPGEPHPAFTTFHQHLGPIAGHESATDVVVQPDGKVVVSILNDDEVDRRIIRLLPSGALDTSFGVGGVWHLPRENATYVRAIALQPDGKIVFAGEDATRPAMVVGRLTAAGALDLTFAGDGLHVVETATGSMPLVEDVFVESSGKVTFTGIVRNGARMDDLFLGRLTSVGTDDPDFAGANPYLVFGSPYDGDQDRFGGIAQMPNGDYIIGNPHSASASQVWRISITGGARVAANVAFPDAFDTPVDVMATDATHAVVLLEGSSTTGLAYLDVAQTPKMSTHAGNSGSIQPFPATFRGHELLRQGDGRFLVSGTDSAGGIHRAIMRLDPVGTPDATWGAGGIRHLSGTSTRRFYLDRHSLAFAPDGSVVSAYHAFAGEVRRPIVEQLVTRVARVRAEVQVPLARGVVGTPIEFAVRAVNDGPDASGAGAFTFRVGEHLRVTSWTGADCTVEATGGTCRFATIPAGEARTTTIRVKAVTAGEHAVSAAVDATIYDDDTANDSTLVTHAFDTAPAPTAAKVAASTPPPAAAATAPKRLRLLLQRITGYDGRVIASCGTTRRMCVVPRVRPGARAATATYLRATATIAGRRTLLLVMQVKQRGRWVTKYRHRLPMGANGGLDIKMPTDWRATSSTWRLRTETVGRRNVKPTVSSWLVFRVR